MTRKLLVLGVVLLLIGGVAAAVIQMRKKRACIFAQRNHAKKSVVCNDLQLPKRHCSGVDKRIDVEVSAKPLVDVLNFLASQGLNLVYCHAFAAPEEGGAVTVSLKQVTVEAAGAVLKSVGWRYELTAEKILIVFGR